VGINALEKAYFVVQGIENWRQQRRSLPLDPLFAHAPETRAASSVTNMQRSDGGNIGRIPAAVQMRIRATVMPGEDPEQIIKGVEKTILAATQEDPWLAKNPPAFSWQSWGGRNYPAKVPVNHPLSTALAQSLRKVIGKEPEFRGFVSPADMQHLNNIEPTTPTVMFGPGNLYAAHADDEGVSIKELATASAVIADFILRWCGEM
jgi:acetylornithine deacetylase